MRPDTLERLRSLREAARNRAGRELAAARTAETRVRAQLDTLTRYEAGYANRRATAAVSGTSVALLRNHFGFASQLSAAIAAADKRVAAAVTDVATKGDVWRAEERALLAYETLSKRQSAAARRTADRAEQRRADARANTVAARTRLRGDSTEGRS